MPWCDTCDRFYNPNSLAPDGTCPTCGRQVAQAAAVADPELAAMSEVPGAPWHFKLLVAATVGYLGWRLIEGIIWIAGRAG